MMWQMGFRTISIAVESGNDRMLKEMHKGESLASIEEAIKTCCEMGFEVTLFFLIGLPAESEEEVRNSFALAERYPIFRARFQRTVPFPGTELFRQIESGRGRFLVEPDVYLNKWQISDRYHLIETPELSAACRVKLMKEARQVEQRIFRRALERNLRRYRPLTNVLAALLASRAVRWFTDHAPNVRSFISFFIVQFLQRTRTKVQSE